MPDTRLVNLTPQQVAAELDLRAVRRHTQGHRLGKRRKAVQEELRRLLDVGRGRLENYASGLGSISLTQCLRGSLYLHRLGNCAPERFTAPLFVERSLAPVLALLAEGAGASKAAAGRSPAQVLDALEAIQFSAHGNTLAQIPEAAPLLAKLRVHYAAQPTAP